MAFKVKFLKSVISGLFILFFLTYCRPEDYSRIPTFSDNSYLHAVIEVPAGSNLDISYSPGTGRFSVGQTRETGGGRIYLPFPANFGFIPSTLFRNDPSETGSMIDIMIIGEKLKTGSIVNVIPLGILIFETNSITEYKVIGIPSDTSLQTIQAGTYADLNLKYPSIRGSIEDWFTYSDTENRTEVLGWGDEHVARQFIGKWQVSYKR